MSDSFLSELGGRLPQIALAILAGRQGGLEGLGAFQGGMLEGQRERDAVARQAQVDEERRQQQALENQRAAESARRAEQAAQLQHVQSALSLLDRYGQQQAETATDPIAAENAMLGRAASLESVFRVPSGQLAGLVPNMAPAITTRKQRQAQELYERAEKLYGPEAMADDSVTLQTGELFGDVKPSQLRAIFATPAVTQAGEPVKPLTAKPQVPNTPEERLADAIRRGDKGEIAVLTQAAETIAGARRRPEDAELAAINKQLAQMRLDTARAAKSATDLPVATQRRVDIKTRAFDAQPVVKRIQTMAEAVTFADGLDPNTKNPADDQAIISAFAKAMDPDSVVREGEYAVVQKYAQSWAERFGFEAARIFSNTQFLTPQARANMKATIRARFDAAKPQYENLRRSYATQIGRITGRRDGDDYLIDYAAAFPAETQASSLGPLTKEAQVGGVYILNGKKVRIREKTRTGFLFDEVD